MAKRFRIKFRWPKDEYIEWADTVEEMERIRKNTTRFGSQVEVTVRDYDTRKEIVYYPDGSVETYL